MLADVPARQGGQRTAHDDLIPGGRAGPGDAQLRAHATTPDQRHRCCVKRIWHGRLEGVDGRCEHLPPGQASERSRQLAMHQRGELIEQAGQRAGLIGLVPAADHRSAGQRVPQDRRLGCLVVDGPGGCCRRRDQGHRKNHQGRAAPVRQAAQWRRQADHRLPAGRATVMTRKLFSASNRRTTVRTIVHKLITKRDVLRGRQRTSRCRRFPAESASYGSQVTGKPGPRTAAIAPPAAPVTAQLWLPLPPPGAAQRIDAPSGDQIHQL